MYGTDLVNYEDAGVVGQAGREQYVYMLAVIIDDFRTLEIVLLANKYFIENHGILLHTFMFLCKTFMNVQQ